MSLGIAFEGCAGRSAFSLGVAAGLYEAGVRPHGIAGASSGAIVAALLAGDRAGDMEQAWMSAAGSPVWAPSEILRGGWPLRMSYVVGGAMQAVFGDLTLSELPLPIGIPVTHMVGGRLTRRFLTRDDPIRVADAVLASCFVPGPYSRVIRIDGLVAFDGAWQLRIPFDAAQELGASRIIVVGGHAVDGIATGYPRVRRIPVPANCRLVRPRTPLAVGPYDTDRDRNLSAIAAGRRAALQFIDEQTAWIDQAS